MQADTKLEFVTVRPMRLGFLINVSGVAMALTRAIAPASFRVDGRANVVTDVQGR